MADLRDQLKKAGLVSEKQARQAKHEERVRAKELGRDGVLAERRARDEAHQTEEEERKRRSRALEEERRRREREEAESQRLAQAIRGGWIREATAGSRRFFFPTRSGRISYLDLSDLAARRISVGAAAIVETRGLVRGEYCVVAERTAAELSRLDPEIIRFWNRTGAPGEA